MISIKHLYNNKNGNQLNNVIIVINDDTCFLFSYNSLIASVRPNEESMIIKRYTDFVSNTTSRHIKAFFEYLNVDLSPKQFYNNIPISKQE